MLPNRNIFLSLFLLVSVSCFGQDASFKFTHYGVEEGLGQSSANALLQDHQDVLWVGSFGGISSFDGYDFRSYKHLPQDSTTINENAVWSLLEDENRNLWIGTKSGLSRFNRINRNFENFYINDPKERRNTLAIKSLFETKDRRLLVGSEGQGLFEFDRKKKVFSPFSTFPDDLKVSSIAEDNEGNIYVGSENKGLFVYRKKEQTVVSFQEAGLLQTSIIWSLFVDTQNTLWVGTDAQGIAYLTKGSGKFVFLKDYHSEFSAAKIQAIKQDKKGRMWIGSATNGLTVYDPKSGHLQKFSKVFGVENGIRDNNVVQIFIGTNDNIFIGYYLNGFDKVREVPFGTFRHNPLDSNSLSHDNVFSMYRDKQDNLWMGTFGGGLNLLSDPRSGKFKHFLNDPKDPTSISHNWVRVMLEDSRGNFWVGTWGGGLNLMDRKKGSFKRYLPNTHDPDDGISLNIITSLFEDSQGVLWIGTYGGGIDLYDPNNQQFSHYKHDENDSTSLSDDHITSFFEDKEKNMWVATYGGGLNKLNRQTGEFTTFIPQPGNPNSISDYKILYLFQEPGEDYIWITTLGGGLNKFYPKQKVFQLYTTDNGLSNNNTLGMLRHTDGTYWISTNYGLTHMNPKTEDFKTYTTADGLGGIDFSLSAFTQDTTDRFYFGGSKGITFFHPDEVKPNRVFPNLIIDQVLIGETTISDLSNLSLEYKERIAIDYAAVNPAKIQGTNYAYRLIGLQDKWLEVGTRRHIEFTTLRPGKYDLQIRSTNGSDDWNTEYLSLAFEITPPWYMQWWFRIGTILFIFSTAIAYYFRKTGQLKKQKIRLETKVSERTATINEKNRDLEQAYQKQKELESFKESMVHMVAHDLKNPLVTILSCSATDDGSERMNQINGSGKNMLMLIENMLDIQKLQETTIDLQLKPFHFINIIKQTVDNMSIVAKQKRIQLNYYIDYNAVVVADEALIERVIINLLSNAIKFSSPDKAVSIDARIQEGRLKIGVTDEGEGIPKEKQDKLFEKYYQFEAKSYAGSRSFGLGLAFCKLVLDAHDSPIEVISEVGKGSSFIFYLPLDGEIVEGVIEGNNLQKNNEAAGNSILDQLSEDDTLFLNGIEEIFSLELYETGEWYQLLDNLNEHESPAVKTFAEDLKLTIMHFDLEGLNKIRLQLKDKIDAS